MSWMQKGKPSLVSLRAIAKAAGVSKTTASYVMRNCAGPSKSTRDHVAMVAKKMGYVPDPHMASYMTQIREAKIKDLESIVWLTGHHDPTVWEKHKFLSPYFNGACKRALELGYRIEIVTDKAGAVPMRRIAKMIYNRGISGVIVTHQFRQHVRLLWDSLAPVALEGRLLAPRLHQVKTSMFYNLLLALKMVRRFGYKRIGVCLDESVDRGSYHTVRAAILYFQDGLPKSEQLAPLFYVRRSKEDQAEEAELEVKGQVLPWVKKHHPDAIICLNNGIERLLVNAGYRVPEDIGLVHLATDDDVNEWAGIHSRRGEIGAAAVGQVVSLIQNRKFGVPNTPIIMEVRGLWHNGRTLLVPKPR